MRPAVLPATLCAVGSHASHAVPGTARRPRGGTRPALLAAAGTVAGAVAFAVAAAAGASPASAQEAELTYKFEPGQRQVYRITQDVEVEGRLKLPVIEQKYRAALKNVIELSARVAPGGIARDDKDKEAGKDKDAKAVPAKGKSRLVVRVDRITVEGELDDQKLRLDTEHKAGGDFDIAAMGGQLLSTVTGKEFDAEVTARGEVTDAAGLKRLATDAAKELGLPLSAEVLAKTDERSVAEGLLRPVFPLLPDGAVKVGATWRQPVAVGAVAAGGLPARIEAEYTLKSVGLDAEGRKVARVSVSVRPDTEALKNLRIPLPTPQIQGVDVTLGVRKWVSDGDLVFLLSEGRLLSGKIDSQLELVAGADIGGTTLGVELKYDGRDRVDLVGGAGK
jgi:hypothetical protein